MCAVCSQLAPAPTRAVCTGQRPGQGLFFRLVSQSARLHARTGMRPHRMSGKSRRTAQRTDGERERERASTVEHRKSRRRPDALCNRRAASATSGPRHESCKTRGVRGGVHGRHLRLSRAGGRLPAASPSFSHLFVCRSCPRRVAVLDVTGRKPTNNANSTGMADTGRRR